MLHELYPDVEVRGLRALIYLPAEAAREMDIIGAAVDGCSIRWLPYLDEGLDDIDHVYELFSESGTAVRQVLARSIKNLIRIRCIACGDYLHEAAYGPCCRCSGHICDVCVGKGDDIRHREGKCLSASIHQETAPKEQATRNAKSKRRRDADALYRPQKRRKPNPSGCTTNEAEAEPANPPTPHHYM